MAALLKIIIFWHLIAYSLQEDAKSPKSKTETSDPSSGSNSIKQLTGDFDHYLTESLAKQAIGLKEMERWLDPKGIRVLEGTYLAGREIIKKLASDLTKRLNDKKKAVQGITTKVFHALNTGKEAPEEYYQCCDLPDRYELTYDPRFKDKITQEIFCTMKAPNHLQKRQLDLRNVKTAFDKNLKESSLKVRWQYYGSAEGVLAGYPGASVSDCDSYDNRLRPWYVTTATPSPKNIIILLDCSTSMGFNGNLEAAIRTSEIVLTTLNPEDKVSVILFNVSTFLPGDQNTDDCYHSTMAYAGTFNVRYFKSFLKGAQPKGGTRFIKAFKRAFQILKHTFNTSSQSIVTRPSMILLLTDGGRKTSLVEDAIVEAVKEEVEMFRDKFKKTSFKLMTLSFGVEKKHNEFLHKLTSATNGLFMSAHRNSDTYSKLKPYFDYLTKVTPAGTNDVVFCPPYVDAWGLGYMITAASAVLKDNKLQGVVGVDIPMTDLISNVQYFSKGAGSKSYAFLFHTRTGITLSHPKLPTPESITEDPNAVNILELEEGKEFKDLFAEVQESAAGQPIQKDIFEKQHYLPRGGSLGNGVMNVTVDFTYHCQPLEVGMKEYTVCIAMEKNDHSYLFKHDGIALGASSHSVTYHRMDVLPEAKTCYHTDTLSYADRSVIQLSAKAFKDPSGYFEEEDSPGAVRRYSKQLMKGILGREIQDSVLNEDISKVALFTSHIENAVWGSENYKSFTTRLVRRYIGTYNGVLRIFPGAPLPANFDHVTRPWFISAAANKDVVTLTPPYLDPLGAGFIVSISHSLKTKFNNKRSLEKLFGVVGGDLAVSSLGAILAKKIGTNCKNAGMRCFLMDNSGYIVYHPNFENVFNDSSKIVSKHITEMDGALAQDLIKNKVMKRRACQNFNLLKLQRFYEITLDDESFKGKTTKKGCESYEIAKLRNTNVFVVQVEAEICLTNVMTCPCDDICKSTSDQFCECPCKGRLKYDICNANVTGESDLPVCAPGSPPLNPRWPLSAHPDDIGECIRINCAQYKSKHDCNEIFGCVWCHKKMTDGSLLEHPRCKKDKECFGGELGRPNPFLLPLKPRKTKQHSRSFKLVGLELSVTTLVAAGSGVGGGILIIIIIICCLCKRKNKWNVDLDDLDMFEPDLPMMDYPGQVQSTMHMGQRQSTINMGQRQSAMYMGQRPSAMHMGQRQSTIHMGQRQSNMQMRLAAPGMQYSQQAMSTMWCKAYGPSQLMNFVPQVSTMQAPVSTVRTAPPNKATPSTPRRVSRSADITEMPTEDSSISYIDDQEF